jgi:hypothetical protein
MTRLNHVIAALSVLLVCVGVTCTLIWVFAGKQTEDSVAAKSVPSNESPSTANASGDGNGTLPNDEPRKVKTLSIHVDQPDAAAAWMTAPTLPAGQPKPPNAATRDVQNAPTTETSPRDFGLLTFASTAGGEQFGSNYPDLAITITGHEGKVSGKLLFLDRPPLLFSGKQRDSDIIIHMLSTPARTFMLSLGKDESGAEILSMINRINPHSNFMLDFKKVDNDYVTSPTFQLHVSECGPSNGAISVAFTRRLPDALLDRVLARDKILSHIKSPDLSSCRNDSESGYSCGESTLGKQLIAALHNKENNLTDSEVDDTAISDLAIETGTELSAIQRLRSLRFVEWVDLQRGECAGSDRSYFVVDKGQLFSEGKFSEGRFLKYIETTLESYLSCIGDGKEFRFRLALSKVGKLRVPPFSSFAKYTVVARSEATRGYPGEWDLFDINFEPFASADDTAATYSIAVYADNLLVSKRSYGNDDPPGKEQFTSPESRNSDENAIGENIDRFFADAPSGVSYSYHTIRYRPARVGGRCSNGE